MPAFTLARVVGFVSLLLPGLSTAALATSAPLRADAGASPVAMSGRVALNGSAWGGQGPYAYEWQVAGATLVNPRNPIAGLDVSAWQPGVYAASLSVRDATGQLAQDAVKFIVPGGPLAGAPQVSAGGTYEFVTGSEQLLRGEITGGSAPYQVEWDLDLDGQADAQGLTARTDFGAGHHLVRIMVRDSQGLEAQQMTSVYVGSKDEIRDLAVPLTIIGISDSGINPYHSEFSAATYPDPRVLELTRNFTRHPCEYISNYPCNAPAIPMTTGQGYYPEQDQPLWHIDTGVTPFIIPGLLYWIPGTKIIGAYSTGGYDDPPADLILDNNGHGTGSAGVAVGNRYGYCPTCLFYIVDGLDEDVVFGFEWAELTSHSHGYTGNLPLGVLALNDPAGLLNQHPSREAVERGVTVIFSAGNGVENAFIVTNETYGSDQNGPAWTVLVGALRRDTSGAIVGEGTPAHISSWGDGWLPSACRTGVNSTCAHSGTSAAAPYTAGVFGHVLRGVREALGDYRTGVREGQVIAAGRPIPDSPFLADGQLTRRELRAVVLKTAAPLDAETSVFPYPVNSNDENRFLFEGYGTANPNSAARALAVLLGEAPLPDRSDRDQFFALDCELRDGLYGGYDRNGDGNADSCAEDIASQEEFAGSGAVSNAPPFVPFAAASGDIPVAPVMTHSLSYGLHRRLAHEPYRTAADCGLPQTANEEDHAQTMSQRSDIEGDLEPCFDSRVTGTVAGYRPKGIFAADDELRGVLPAASEVQATVYLQSLAGGPVQLDAYLTADDRIIAQSEPVMNITQPQGWTGYEFAFSTDRVAVPGERLGVHFTLTGTIEWAYGFTGDHASTLTVIPAGDARLPMGATIDSVAPVEDGIVVSGQVGMPDLGPDTDLGGAGFAPATVTVEVANNPEFESAVWASVDARGAHYQATLPGAAASEAVYVRAYRNQWVTPTVSLVAAQASSRDLAGVSRGGAIGGGLLLLMLVVWGRRRCLR